MTEYTDSSPKSQAQFNQIMTETVLPAVRDAVQAGAQEIASARFTHPDVFDIDEAAAEVIRATIGFLFLCNVSDDDPLVLHPAQFNEAHIRAWFGVE